MQAAKSIFLAPHPDDIALSCGGLVGRLVRQGETPLIVTCCSLGPDSREPWGSTGRIWQAQCGGTWRTSSLRRGEDRAAAAEMQSRLLDLHCRDAAFRANQDGVALYGPSPVGVPIHAEDEKIQLAKLCRRLKRLLRMLPSELRVFVPWADGGHVDHRLVRFAAEAVFDAKTIVYYADLPYAIRAVEAVVSGAKGDPRAELIEVDGSELERKLRAVWCYKSQLIWLFGESMHRRFAKGVAMASAATGILFPIPRAGLGGPPSARSSLAQRSGLSRECYWWPSPREDAGAEVGALAASSFGRRVRSVPTPEESGTATTERVAEFAGHKPSQRPLRILLVNAFHHLRGGVERAYLDESRWLSAAGHTVMHFATQDPRNVHSPTADYFAPGVDFSARAHPVKLLSQLPNVAWSAPASTAMARLLRDHRPDVAHVHAPSRYLTPSILQPLVESGVPVVMTLHDFKLWCTNRTMFAGVGACERCKSGHHYHALLSRCVQGSYLKSAVGMLEAYVHDLGNVYRSVKLWIAPSSFVATRATALGLPAGQVHHLSHAVEFCAEGDSSAPAGTPSAGPYALFAGRLSLEKGVRLLPEIAMGLRGARLVVAGDGPERAWLDERAKAIPHLDVIGHQPDGALMTLRRQARAFVLPSLAAETFSYATAEALLTGLPVVAFRSGAIPELVEHGVTGWLAEPGDVSGLTSALNVAIATPASGLANAAALDKLHARLRPEHHTSGLLELYEKAIRG